MEHAWRATTWTKNAQLRRAHAKHGGAEVSTGIVADAASESEGSLLTPRGTYWLSGERQSTGSCSAGSRREQRLIAIAGKGVCGTICDERGRTHIGGSAKQWICDGISGSAQRSGYEGSSRSDQPGRERLACATTFKGGSGGVGEEVAAGLCRGAAQEIAGVPACVARHGRAVFSHTSGRRDPILGRVDFRNYKSDLGRILIMARSPTPSDE